MKMNDWIYKHTMLWNRKLVSLLEAMKILSHMSRCVVQVFVQTAIMLYMKVNHSPTSPRSRHHITIINFHPHVVDRHNAMNHGNSFIRET